MDVQADLDAQADLDKVNSLKIIRNLVRPITKYFELSTF